MNAGRKVVVLAATLCAMSAATGAAQAQGDYPARPVTLILPYGAGGVADVSLRILGERLSDRLKQPFVIENRPGAGGVVAAQAGASAAPDGYTLLMTGTNTAITTSLFKSLPYNILTDFDSVSTVADFDVLIVTRAGSPLHSLADFIAAARANPGKLNVGTVNPGGAQNLAVELFNSAADIKAAIVPFRTSPDMAGAVLRGDVDVAFEYYAALSGLLTDNKIVALATTGATRTAYLPDVPTAIESGIKGYDATTWNGLSVPAHTPPSVIATLNAAMKEVIAEPAMQSRANQMGMAMRWSTADDMTARMKADIAKWGSVIDKAGIPKHD